MTLPSMLQGQFDLWLSGREDPEAWVPDHEDAMRCRRVEDTISFGLAILATIRRRAECWTEDVEAGKTQFSWEAARECADMYRWWLERGTLALKLVEECEAKGYTVERAGEFREEIRDVSLMSLDTEHDRKSLESLQSGHGIPSKQAMDELRHSLRTGSP